MYQTATEVSLPLTSCKGLITFIPKLLDTSDAQEVYQPTSVGAQLTKEHTPKHLQECLHHNHSHIVAQ